MRRLAQEAPFDEVLALPVAQGGSAHAGVFLQAVAALLCGQFERALTLAGELQAAPELAERVPQLRAVALLHLGRYDEAPPPGRPAPSGEVRTLLAQAAVETGDHRSAEASWPRRAPTPWRKPDGCASWGPPHPPRRPHRWPAPGRGGP